MDKINWPPEKTIKYEFNDLEKDFIEIKAENGGKEKQNKSKGTEK